LVTPNGDITWIRPGGTPFVPGWRDRYAAKRGIHILDDFTIPNRLRSPEPDDTS
jgi:hypothetical protein